MAKITGIDHLAIESSSLKELRRFFVNILGMKVYKDYGDEVFFKIGSQLFAIFKSKSKKAKLNHIAFKSDNPKKLKSKLKKLGYKLHKWDIIHGPKGVRIQVV
jgi:catechol 2,3-dioxygenase-like lactoylglutathione lyase family enzyme